MAVAPRLAADEPSRISVIDGEAPFRLWSLNLTIAPSAHEHAWLSQHELDRAARFHAARDRARYIAAHVGMRLLVETACGIDAEAQHYERDALGKWRLADQPEWHFNLSYAGDTALVGIAANNEIGVDVETIRVVEEADALAAMYFNRCEYRAYRRCAADRDAAAFLSGWTRKEACLKALGVGLQLAPIELDTGLSGVRPVVHGGSHLDVGSFHFDGLIAAWARVR